MPKMKHHLRQLFRTAEKIETVVAIKNVDQMEIHLAAKMEAVRIRQIANHNDSNDQKMAVAKMPHTNAQRETTIVMTKTSQQQIRKQRLQQVHFNLTTFNFISSDIITNDCIFIIH